MRNEFERRPLSRRDLVRGAAAGGAAAAVAIGGSLLPGSIAAAAPAPDGDSTTAKSPARAPAPAARNGVTGFDDWLGSVVQVANVAANMLPLFLVANGAKADAPTPPPFQAGGVQFEYLTLDGQTDLYAHNISGEDAGLSYSLTRSEPAVNLSVYQPLPANGAYPCQGDLSDFVNGQVYLAPTPVTRRPTGR